MSENKNSSRWIKVGKVIKKKAGGVCVIMGDPDNKSANFKYNVEIRVTDSQGKVVANAKNFFLSVFDPRKRPGISEEQAAKIPQSLVSELFFVENND